MLITIFGILVFIFNFILMKNDALKYQTKGKNKKLKSLIGEVSQLKEVMLNFMNGKRLLSDQFSILISFNLSTS
jgi:hypothetical protein